MIKPKYDWSKALALYQMGKNDHEISRALCIPPTSICSWRSRNSLPRMDKKAKKAIESHDLLRADAHEANVLGISYGTLKSRQYMAAHSDLESCKP